MFSLPSYLPSQWEKKLFRYVLTHLDFLEDATLADLSNLEGSIGYSNLGSTLKNVNIKVDRLKQWLKTPLPPRLSLTHAVIGSLTVKIPTNLLLSGSIEILISDVRLCAKITPAAPTSSPPEPGSPDDDDDDDGSASEDEYSTTAEDLARSFLHSQPQPEQELLLKSLCEERSHDMTASRASTASSADDDDDDDNIGVGTAVGLPRILANMFKGIGDRLKVQIRSVSVALETFTAEQPVVVELEIEDVDVEGVTTASVKSTWEPGKRRKEGKRCITLEGINAYITAEAAMFEALSPVAASTVFGEASEATEIRGGERMAGSSESALRGSSNMADSTNTLKGYTLPQEAPIATVTSTTSQVTAPVAPSKRTPTPQEHDDNDEGVRIEGSADGGLFSESDQFASFNSEESSDEELLAFAPSFPANRIRTSSVLNPGSGSGSFSRPRINYDDDEDSEDEGGAAFGLSMFPEATLDPYASDADNSESGDEMDADASRMLSESTLFTHSEAGSLYLSATSGVLGEEREGMGEEEGRIKDEVDEEAVGKEEMDERLDALLGGGVAPELEVKEEEEEEAKSLKEESLGAVERRVKKRIFNLDRIEIFTPSLAVSTSDSTVVVQQDPAASSMEDSQYPHVPGAFSMYASRRHLPSSPPLSSSIPSSPPRPRRQTVKIVTPTASVELTPRASEIEVSAGQAEAKMDFATAKVLGMVVEAVMGAVGEEGETVKRRRNVESGEAGMGVEIVVAKVGLRLVEKLKGVYLQDDGEEEAEEEAEEVHGGGIVLECLFKGIKVTHSTLAQNVTSSKVEVKKVTLGDNKEDILSFIPPPPLPPTSKSRKRSSHPPSTAAAAPENDIMLIFSQSPSKKRINVITLPIKLHFDLKRLEETLGAFGGVGGVLASTSTTASTVTITKSRSAETPKKWSRETEQEVVRSSDTKVSCQIGGLVVEIVGTTGKFGIETSEVKIRSESAGSGGVVVGLEKIGVYAPNLPWDHSPGRRQVGTSVLVENARVEFLSAPGDEDLARLLELLTPSKDQFADDDDILIDTLLRQRQQGSALRIGIGGVKVVVEDLGVATRLQQIGNEVMKVLTVTDFVAQDERPGLLTLLHVDSFHGQVDIGGGIGRIEADVKDVGVAHVSAPSLVAVALGKIVVRRDGSEELLGEALERRMLDKSDEGKHMLMVRIVGDEPEPVIKLKLWNTRVEYRVETLMALTSTPPEKVTAEVLANEMVQSVISVAEKGIRDDSPPLGFDVLIRDCVLGLNPLGLKSRGLVVLTDSRLQAALPTRGLLSAGVEVKKAFVMLIDDTANLLSATEPRRRKPKVNKHHDGLASLGYVSVIEVSSARVTLQIVEGADGEKAVDLEVYDDLLLMESCADSTQTLLGIVNGLKPPLVEEEAVKYCTQVMEVDMFRSLTEDAFLLPRKAGKQEWHPVDEDDGDSIVDGVPMDMTFVESYYGHQPPTKSESSFTKDKLANSMLDEDLGSIAPTLQKPLGLGEKGMLASFTEQVGMYDTDSLNYVEDHFGKARGRATVEPKKPAGPTITQWDSSWNRYVSTPHPRRAYFPLRIRVRDVHLIWNLHDGYDWRRTRDTISAAVKRVEYKAAQRRDRRVSFDVDEDEESVIGDFLFNSIYIGIPANRDPKELSKAIAKEFDDHMSETSFAPSSMNESSRPSSRSRNTEFGGGRVKNLKLSRSKTHKLQFELKGVCVDFLLFPPDSGETQSSVDVKVRDLEIIDNVPTSTWKKFVTYMQDAGGRETGSSMVHLGIMNVRPVKGLAASEIVLKVTVLPLRLHVDQDTLDFMTRFFEFKDDTVTAPEAPGDIPFLQRVEVNSIRVKLDYKPKKVDYAGLRSGRTTEFMNFFILEEADMVLRHCVLYGISGFSRMSQVLNDTWMPDVKNTQLGDVLAGVAPVRSLANIGGGIKDLVAVPMYEYKKDGRIVRAVQKGAIKFAKTTTSELVRLGAKVAVGTQNVLQGAEDFLVPTTDHHDDEYVGSMSDSDDDVVLAGAAGGGEKKVISLYADQPTTVVQGLRGASDSLRRNFGSARDAIMDVPRDIAERGSAQGAAKAVARAAPVAIIRPMIGATEAVSRTLLGVTNALDPEHKRRVDDKYKKH